MTFFSKDTFQSIIFQILIVMLLIAALALASMSVSVYLTLATQDDAEAINLAGSLRMQSYRIGHILSRASEGEIADAGEQLAREKDEFAEKLYRSSIFQSIEQSGNTTLKDSYRRVVDNWQEHIHPLLAVTAASGVAIPWRDIRQQYNHYLSNYVDEIDLMVAHMQKDTEGKMESLAIAEGATIVMIFLIMIFFTLISISFSNLETRLKSTLE